MKFIMGEQRRRYSEEFKREAVELSYRPGKTVAETAESLGINSNLLSRWRAERAQKGQQAFPGCGKQKLTSMEEENLRLKKELADVREERDILKKATAIFSKKSK